MLKILFVTSETTYIPGNYLDLLEELFKAGENSNGAWKVAGVISIKTINLNLAKTLVGLPLIGVRDLTKTLVENILKTPFHYRENLCRDYGVAHLKAKSMNDEDTLKWIGGIGPDLILNLRTRCIYKEKALKAARLGCVNIHHGLLPKYRGTFCDLYALYEGRPAGFSLHKMEKKVDAGEIFKVVEVDPGTEKNYKNYLKKTILPEVETLKKFFDKCASLGHLPKGKENKSQKKIYTKNPTNKTIRSFKERGLFL